jgi:hypothetical protein
MQERIGIQKNLGWFSLRGYIWLLFNLINFKYMQYDLIYKENVVGRLNINKVINHIQIVNILIKKNINLL